MICICIADVDFDTCLRQAEQAEAIEVRLDLMDKLTPDQMKAITLTGCQWIATCRAGKLSDEERFEQLAQAIVSGATFVDIEYEADKNYRDALLRNARHFSCNIIVSYHNFEETPDDKTFRQIIREGRHMGADYIKIATMVQNESDNERLLHLYDEHDQLIAFGMGEMGKRSRIAAAPHSIFTYVALDEPHKTAPGQLTYAEACALHLDEDEEE